MFSVRLGMVAVVTTAATTLATVGGASASPVPTPQSAPSTAEHTRLAAVAPTVVLRRCDWRNRTYRQGPGAAGLIRLHNGSASLDDVTYAQLGAVQYAAVGGVPSAVVGYRIVDVPSLNGADDKHANLGLHVFQVRRGRVTDVGHGVLPLADIKGTWSVRVHRGGLSLRVSGGAFYALEFDHGDLRFARMD